MELEIPEDVLAAISKSSKAKTRILQNAESMRSSESIDHTEIEADDLPLIKEITQSLPVEYRHQRRARNQLVRRINAISNLQKGKKIVNLEVMAEAIRKLMNELPHHWIFIEDSETKEFVPWMFDDCQFHHSYTERGYYHPAHITLQAVSMRRGNKEKVSNDFERPHLQNGMTPAQALAALGWLPETEELLATYTEQMEKYKELAAQEGTQLVAVGRGKLVAEDTQSEDDDDYSYRWYRNNKFIVLGESGNPARLIMDDKQRWGKDTDLSFKINSLDRSKQDDEDEDGKVVHLPKQPYLRCFDLKAQVFVEVHVENVDEYLYKRDLYEKLIVPEETKTLIEALVEGEVIGDDIVTGKGKGIIILTYGPPGVGKTLSAEVYSERSRRPLYMVQCSQLGTEPQELEKELSIVLSRASRWRCILLLDEGDVYCRERGEDLTQNAIVGVFLRLLEYYQGVLFIATNRADIIDDAIVSRCVAQIPYRLPDEGARRQIWKIMSDQFHVGLTDPMIDKLTKTFDTISPRSIKQLCRVVKSFCDYKKTKPDVKTFEWMDKFQNPEKD